MKPFFSFYGAKWKLAKRFGQPRWPHVIEPFAGSAGYSVHWEPRQVTLVEKDDVIAGVWDYLIRVEGQEVMKLPININDKDELPAWVPQEAVNLIGFWFDHGMRQPSVRRSKWARSNQFQHEFWGQRIRQRIAGQVGMIKHWKLVHGGYEKAGNATAHWHIDPPYCNGAGRLYKHHSVDYVALGAWCKKRKGFVQVCENGGAEWLPFQPMPGVNLGRRRKHGHDAFVAGSGRPTTAREAVCEFGRVNEIGVWR